MRVSRTSIFRLVGRPGRRKIRRAGAAAALAATVAAGGIVPAAPASAQNACDITGFGASLSDLVGLLPIPGGSQASAAFGAFFNIGEKWACGNDNVVQQMIEIAREQAEAVFDEQMMEIFDEQLDNLVTQMAGLEPLVNPTDAEIGYRVGDLDGLWKAFDDLEETIVGQDFRALPGLTVVAGLKIGVLTQLVNTQTLSATDHWKAADDRFVEAAESLGYITSAEGDLVEHIDDRFVKSVTVRDEGCTNIRCYAYAEIEVRDTYLDKELFEWHKQFSGMLPPSPTNEPEYIQAMATANQLIEDGEADIRSAYLTPMFDTVKDKLQTHAATSASSVFRQRDTICNYDQYLILMSKRSAPDGSDRLAVQAMEGSVNGSHLTLAGTLAQAKENDSAQYKQIRYGTPSILKVRDQNITMHAWGGTYSGAEIRLHGGVNYAEDHNNSQFLVYRQREVASGGSGTVETKPQRLIFQVVGRDRTIGLTEGRQSGSRLVLGTTLEQAIDNPDHQFEWLCWPTAER